MKDNPMRCSTFATIGSRMRRNTFLLSKGQKAFATMIDKSGQAIDR
jgi:hypothetical protein